MNPTSKVSKADAISSFFIGVRLIPGVCSPSRSVVSKKFTCSGYLENKTIPHISHVPPRLLYLNIRLTIQIRCFVKSIYTQTQIYTKMEKEDDNRFIAYEAYKKLADPYAELVNAKPHNAYLERPALLSLIPDVKNLITLDAGCGTGTYSEWLVLHGAKVVSLDASPYMLRHARNRLKGRAVIRLHDLRDPLTFIEDNSIDIVLSSLVMHYIKDWEPVLGEFKRILRTGGVFVFSIGHPFADFSAEYGAENYFAIEKIEMLWTGFGEKVIVPSFRHPLGYVFRVLRDRGFNVDRIIETQPTIEYCKADPEGFERVKNRPTFLCVRAVN